MRRDPRLFAREYYLFHPKAGVYELKEYQASPFETSGVGAHLAASVPAELSRLFERQAGVFGIVEVQLAKLRGALDEIAKGAPLDETGFRIGVRIPMQGPAQGAPSSLRFLDSSLEKKRRLVDAEFRKLIDRRGLTRAYA